jgi:hypothetical protein
LRVAVNVEVSPLGVVNVTVVVPPGVPVAPKPSKLLDPESSAIEAETGSDAGAVTTAWSGVVDEVTTSENDWVAVPSPLEALMHTG